MPATLGVLLAGGAGTRLALGVPKPLVRLGGITLLERALGTLASLCDEVAVAAPAALVLPGGIRTANGAPAGRVDDAPGASGPLAGLVGGLSARDFERALVLGVDFPLMEPATLAALLARLAGHEAVIPVPGGVPQPLAGAYAPAARRILAERLAAGERAVTRAVESLQAVRLDDEAVKALPGGLEAFFNLNTRADLAAAERRLAAREAAR